MLNIIEKARLLAKDIQNTDEYIEFMKCKTLSETDPEIMNLVNQIDLCNINISREQQKSNPDQVKLDKYKLEINSLKSNIHSSTIVKNYNITRDVLNDLMNQIYKIFINAVNGEDVDNIDTILSKDNNNSGGCCRNGCAGCQKS